MNPLIATAIYACGIAGLFYLDRDKTVNPSKSLWIPIIWIGIVSSRSVSEWLGLAPNGPNVEMGGSPLDAALFGILEFAALGVLIRRGRRTRALLVANLPILAYFGYCLLSVSWSSYPEVAVKRWIKAIGDLLMVLVIVTDREPLNAIRRVIMRLGFVLLPVSLLLMKYYPQFGRNYTPDGMQVYTGVTSNKNTLGVVLLVISLGTLANVMTTMRSKGQPGRRRHLIAQGTLLAFGVYLLRMADSQTSLACFVLGSIILVATRTKFLQRRPVRVHVLCSAIVLGGALMLYGGQAAVAGALGRQATFSGRTEIWANLIPTVPNAIMGAGFESYWISPSAKKFLASMTGWWHPEILISEAHNGYIEVYMNLGLMGVCLIIAILFSGYARAVKGFRRNPSTAGLMLAYIIASAAYSFTEAGFRMLNPEWIFLLLAIVSSSGVAGGMLPSAVSKRRVSSIQTSTKVGDPDRLVTIGRQVYSA